jgi:hypothetical protein
MTRKLKRIAPVKFGIVVGACYGVIALIFVPFFLLGIVISMFAPAPGGSMQQGLSIGLSLLFCVILPVIYAVLGCLFGMLGALIYNLIAGWIGGIEFEVE